MTLPILIDSHALRLLTVHYGAPGRHFHGPAHLIDVMRLWRVCHDNGYWTSMQRAIETALALAYHDADYIPGATNNEETSAGLAMDVCKLYGVDKERVRDLILATKRHDEDFDTDPDMALMLDIDLARWGRSELDNIAATAELRLEYAAFSDGEWSVGRRAFLEKMLRRKSIYRTGIELGSSESFAQKNIRRELRMLPCVTMPLSEIEKAGAP